MSMSEASWNRLVDEKDAEIARLQRVIDAVRAVCADWGSAEPWRSEGVRRPVQVIAIVADLRAALAAGQTPATDETPTEARSAGRAPSGALPRSLPSATASGDVNGSTSATDETGGE